MGRDKALILVDGIPMLTRVTQAMRAAGATEVFAVGGDPNGLAPLGERVVDDLHAGEGPLGGIITALATATHDIVVVTACDMPWIEAVDVESVVHALGVDALGDFEVAVSAADGQLQPLHAAWHRHALPTLQRTFADGERSPARVIPTLKHAVVELGIGQWSTDIDTPDDLPESN